PYPLPARGAVHFDFSLEEDATVTLAFYDVRGRRVRDLVPGLAMRAGSHAATWDGRDDHGRRLGPGVYFARLTLSGSSLVRRVAALLAPALVSALLPGAGAAHPSPSRNGRGAARRSAGNRDRADLPGAPSIDARARGGDRGQLPPALRVDARTDRLAGGLVGCAGLVLPRPGA